MIKEGEYIRTNLGYIAKITNNNVFIIVDRPINLKQDSGNYYSYSDMFMDLKKIGIVKHSKNIIDLIEVGDIIQYKELKKLNCGTSVGQKYVGNIADKEELEEVKKEIQTKGIELVGIVTKEQFNSVMYKVGDIE